MRILQIVIIKPLFISLPLLVGGCANLGQVADSGAQISQAVGYNPVQISSAVKEVLELSANRATDKLGQSGGYSSDANFKIALPGEVQEITKTLRSFGLGSYLDNIETLMNKGAEKAAVEAKPLLIDSIKKMNVADAMGIIRGGDHAATEYFRKNSESAIRTRYQNIVDDQLKQLGFFDSYKQLLNAYKLVPISNKPDLNLDGQVVDLGLNALFKQIGEEEAKIRANPVEHGSALIGAIFSQ